MLSNEERIECGTRACPVELVHRGLIDVGTEDEPIFAYAEIKQCPRPHCARQTQRLLLRAEVESLSHAAA